MKRNLDLIRDILLICEEDNSLRLTCDNFACDGKYSFEQISYHIALLSDANYIDASRIAIMGNLYDDYIVHRLTMRGHDYLYSIRDESIWNQTKAKLGNHLSSATLSVISEVASSILKTMIGI